MSVSTCAGEPRTFAIPLQTDEGMNYVVVVLGRSPATQESFRRSARQLLPTLAVLLLATAIAALLVCIAVAVTEARASGLSRGRAPRRGSRSNYL